MRLSPVFAFVALLLLSACGANREKPAAADPQADSEAVLPATPLEAPRAPLLPATQRVEAPEFALEAMDGGRFRLSEQRGKVVIVNLWATWCPPCRDEIPDFIALQDELGGRGLVIAGVSLDDAGWDVVRPFAEGLGTNYPIMLDDGTVEREYGPLSVLPTTFLVDRDGVVAYYAPGMINADELRPTLLEMLGDR